MIRSIKLSKIPSSFSLLSPRRKLGTSREVGKPFLGRYNVVPEELVRIGTSKIKLREKSQQLAKNIPVYDFAISPDGFILPAEGDLFKDANGLSLRPYGTNLIDLLATRKKNTPVVIVPKGLELPKELVLIHEFGDHFSLQTTVKEKPDIVNARLTALLKSLQCITSAEYFERRTQKS